MEDIYLCPIPCLPLSLLTSAPATHLSPSVRWYMSDLQWWIYHLLPSGSLTASMIHMTSLLLTLLGAARLTSKTRLETGSSSLDSSPPLQALMLPLKQSLIKTERTVSFPIVLWDELETPSADLIYYLRSNTDIPINKLQLSAVTN